MGGNIVLAPIFYLERSAYGAESPSIIGFSRGRRLAIPGRLELPTYGLGNRRSIRLSYGTAEPAKRGLLAPFISKQKQDRKPFRSLPARRDASNRAACE